MQLDEKKAIEKATAEGFLKLYNQDMDTSYRIAEHSDSPDIRCEDTTGNRMNLEITLTEDRPGDIQALLGRSDHLSQEASKARYEEVRQGKRNIFECTRCLSGNVMAMIMERIRRKLRSDYGPNTALVIRDTSRLDWDWDVVVEDVKNTLNLTNNPYDKGIWIISNSKDRIFRVS
jgi:hypothetical protein